MREIKFRAWDKRNKKMLKVGCLEFFTDDTYIINQEIPSNEVILMQFTGLKDKNGVEIYEGDIVKGKYGTYKIYFGEGCEGEPADYCGGYIGWCIDDTTTGITCGEEFEVIGNIYQNPNLLEVNNGKE